MIGITTFSPKGYELYGKNFLKHIDYWPGKIILYLEEPIDFEHPKLDKRDFWSIDYATEFLANIEEVPQAHGNTEHGYDYNFDVNKFCRKMFCQYDAFKEGGKMFWLDGDTQFRKKINLEYLVKLFKGEHLVFLGREGFYTETGIIGFDTDHIAFEEFKNRYQWVLSSGKVFTLKGWHDCYCFDWAREGKGHNLTSHWKPGDSLEVFKQTDLKDFMLHYKGNRKHAIKKN